MALIRRLLEMFWPSKPSATVGEQLHWYLKGSEDAILKTITPLDQHWIDTHSHM